MPNESISRQPRLKDMTEGQTFDGLLLIRSAAIRDSKTTGKPFMDLTVCDISGEVNAKMWNGFTGAPNAGDVAHIKGKMTFFKDKPQFNITAMTRPSKPESIDWSLLVPCAPYPATEMRGLIEERITAIQDEPLRTLVRTRLVECGARLQYYPAAKSLHHAEKSGLLHHISTMLRMADKVCEVYPFLDADLLAAGVILHDLCKLTEIDADANGIASAYTAEGELLGHLVLGVAHLQVLGESLNTPRETLLMLQHMILSHHDLPEYGSPKPPMFPEAEVLHALDLLDARMYEMKRELDGVKPGCFTERIWSLDRRLYKRNNPQESTPEESSEKAFFLREVSTDEHC